MFYYDSAKESREPREPRGKRFDKKAEESKPSSGKISLFDFLEDKLPVQPESADTILSSQSNDSNLDPRLESRGTDAQSGRGARYVITLRSKTAFIQDKQDVLQRHFFAFSGITHRKVAVGINHRRGIRRSIRMADD